MNGSLVVQTGYLGDLVMTLPLARALRQRVDGEAVTMLVRRGLGELALAQSYVDNVIELDKGVRAFSRLREDVRVVQRLRQQRFKTVYAAHRSLRSRLLVRLSGAKRRIGFAGRAAGWAYSDSVPYLESEHAVDRFLALGGFQGSWPTGRSWIAVSPAAGQLAEQLVGECGRPDRAYAVVAPGSVWPTKRWTERGFIELVRWISATGVRPVLVGSASERLLTARIAKTESEVIDLGGKTDLLTLVALIRRATYVVGNDSGVGHLAAAVGTPVASIFGPTAPEFGFTPWSDQRELVQLDGLDCRPCSRHGGERCPLAHHDCMKKLHASSVVEAIRRLNVCPDTSEAPSQESSSTDSAPLH